MTYHGVTNAVTLVVYVIIPIGDLSGDEYLSETHRTLRDCIAAHGPTGRGSGRRRGAQSEPADLLAAVWGLSVAGATSRP